MELPAGFEIQHDLPAGHALIEHGSPGRQTVIVGWTLKQIVVKLHHEMLVGGRILDGVDDRGRAAAGIVDGDSDRVQVREGWERMAAGNRERSSSRDRRGTGAAIIPGDRGRVVAGHARPVGICERRHGAREFLGAGNDQPLACHRQARIRYRGRVRARDRIGAGDGHSNGKATLLGIGVGSGNVEAAAAIGGDGAGGKRPVSPRDRGGVVAGRDGRIAAGEGGDLAAEGRAFHGSYRQDGKIGIGNGHDLRGLRSQ